MTTGLFLTPEDKVLHKLQALSQIHRWKLIVLFMAWGEQCVTDLVTRLDIEQPKVSHHLAILKSAGLIKSERRGRHIYYDLSSVWDKKEDAIELLVGGKVQLKIMAQPWVETD